MIGKAKSNKSLVATIAYNLKEKAELIFTNGLSGEDINDNRLQMLAMQKCYTGTARQLTLHVILSPHISEGQNLRIEKWTEIANRYLSLMRLKEHQAIGFIHNDKEHRHLHLVINKVRSSNVKLYHDGFIGKRTQKAADSIAIQMKLIRAKEIMRQNNERKKKVANIDKDAQEFNIETISKPIGSKQLFKQQLNNILQGQTLNSVEEYFTEVKKQGFKIYLYHNKDTKELRGYGIEKNNTKMDASTIDKKFTLTKLSAIFMENALKPNKEFIINNKNENNYPKKRGIRL